MDITSFLEGISLSADSFVTIKLKEGFSEDNIQLVAMSEHSASLFPCMRDRFSANTLIYDTNGFVALDKYLAAAVFSAQGLQDFLLSLSGLERKLTSSALRLSNIVFKPQYIFINPYTKQVRFIYIPVSINTGISDFSSSLCSLIKHVITNCAVDNAYELFSFVLSKINSPSFSSIHFHDELIAFSPKTARMIARKGRLRILGAVLLTLIITAASSIGIPVLADFLNYKPIEKYFPDDAMLMFAILFGCGAAASVLIAAILALTLSSKSKLPKTAKVSKIQAPAPQYIVPGVTISNVPNYNPANPPEAAPVASSAPAPMPTPVPVPMPVAAEPELVYATEQADPIPEAGKQSPEDNLENIVIGAPVE